MIVTTNGKRKEIRSFIPERRSILSTGDSFGSYNALGIPAVYSAIRTIADLVSALPMQVYKPDKTRAEGTWQYRLLHDQPNDFQPSGQFFGDLAASIEVSGNAFIEKVKLGQEVVALHLLNPQRVSPRRRSGKVVFEVSTAEGNKTLGPDRIIHIRDFLTDPEAVAADSPLSRHRSALAAIAAVEEYQRAAFRQGAQSPGVLRKEHGAAGDKALRDIADQFQAQNGGPHNQGQPIVLESGWTWEPLPIASKDAQFAETKALTLGDAALIFGVPESIIRGTAKRDEIEQFISFRLTPKLVRIQQALTRDPDLFGNGAYCEFLTGALLRASETERWSIYSKARQLGIFTANDIRRAENLPEIEGGDSLLETPVGGAPNEV